jgi:hypothetical protein
MAGMGELRAYSLQELHERQESVSRLSSAGCSGPDSADSTVTSSNVEPQRELDADLETGFNGKAV